jgi:Protein of unknown function (DUF3592)
MGWVFAAALVVFILYAGVQLYRYRGNAEWPTAEGIIEGAPEIHGHFAEGSSYYAVLFYLYSVNGERYSGTWTSPFKPKKQQLLSVINAKLAAGSKIAIRYNPKKLTLSVADIDASLFNEDEIIALGL